jgi:hypothetical protein
MSSEPRNLLVLIIFMVVTALTPHGFRGGARPAVFEFLEPLSALAILAGPAPE